jgi:hypothetical protein
VGQTQSKVKSFFRLENSNMALGGRRANLADGVAGAVADLMADEGVQTVLQIMGRLSFPFHLQSRGSGIPVKGDKTSRLKVGFFRLRPFNLLRSH